MNTTEDFPTETRQFYLTNYIELIKIESLYQSGINQFEIKREPPTNTPIRNIVAQYKIYPSTYTIYKVTEQRSNRFKIIPVAYSTYILRNTIYLMVNNNISETRDRLEIRAYDMWQTKALNMRFPLIMPSRGKIFR
ncbi:MAG TPA: hypothetical protein VMW42_06170 [Desulfatiglandales bacterium]|nr:hypothetical protein [Desulfatiglandales bacterium]